METVAFFTLAYNAEKTLRRSVDSVLSQSCNDLVYYLCDNGSTDGTRMIVKDYEKKDERIKSIYFDTNKPYKAFLDTLSTIIKGEYKYFCMIDANDECAPDFLEKMLGFMEDNNLDISVCGHKFVDEQVKKLNGISKLDKNLILTDATWSDCFPIYHQYMWSARCKVFSIDLLKKCNFTNIENMIHDVDMLFTMEAFRHASRAGILIESIHKFDIKHVETDRLQDDVTRQFLLDKCGVITPQNEKVINATYFYAIEDTLSVLLLDSQVSTSDKIKEIHGILTSEHTQRLLGWEGLIEEKKGLFTEIDMWLVEQKNSGIKEYAQNDLILIELETALSHVLSKLDVDMFNFLIDVRKNSPKTSEQIDIQIYEIIDKYPMLTGANAQDVIFMQDVVCAVMREDFRNAFNEVIKLSENKVKVPLEHTESYLTLAQYICATLEYSEGWIFFRKLWAEFLADTSRTDEAHIVVNELNEMLSNDSDVSAPVSYRSCNMINSFFLNFYTRIDKGLDCMALCCEGLDDIPTIPFGNTAKESVESFVKMRKSVITEGMQDMSADERIFSKGCLNCANYQLGEWPKNDLISYVNFSMYPAPCQCKCFYCDIRKDGLLNFTDDPEIEKGYRHMFDMLKYARENGLIASNAVYQVSSGEITIHPYKDEILEFTKGQAAAYYTNCFIFDAQIAENLISNPRSCINLSIDAGTAETWYKVKGVNNFNQVVENLERYYSCSIKEGQITLKYIILPGLNDGDEDFTSLVELMKRFGVQSLNLARDMREKYSQSDELNEKLIQSTARLATMLYKNSLQFGMFTFKPIERERIVAQLKENIQSNL